MSSRTNHPARGPANGQTYYPTQLEQWAHSAWSNLSLSPPVNLLRVSDHLAIQVARETLAPSIYGVYARYEEGRSIILIEAALPAHEQRRVWAHEIHHHLTWRYIPGVIQIYCSDQLRQTPLERQCDLFAVHLLMPEAVLRAECARLGHPHRLDKTRTLAAKFGVSLRLMCCRLRALGLAAHRPPYRHR